MQHHAIIVKIDNKEIVFENGVIARQANGSVLVRCGETMVLATSCASAEPIKDVDFLPLRVDYQERLSSIGRTVSGFIKREGKPSQNEILVSRLIDRPIRPLFDDGYYHDVQLLASVLSYDGVNIPDVLAVCACSAALAISDIPLTKPVGAVRVGLIDNNFVVNPEVEAMKKSKLDLVLAGTKEAILMIEGSADFVSEEQILQAIDLGQAAIRKICDGIEELQKLVGKPKKVDSIKHLNTDIVSIIEKMADHRIKEVMKGSDKKEREKKMKELQTEITESLTNENANPRFDAIETKRAIKHYFSHTLRKMILDEGIRSDGRSLTEIRNINIRQSFLPRTHGSSLFTRGETQTLAVCVLGPESMGQRYEDLNGEGTQSFYLQYFFPPFSVGEVGRIGPPGRREIGHGKLAERALQAVLPPKESFPYTIRLESNILESNGSSSMASVCGGCLALMDAGVPIKQSISGIAMGLILENGKYAVLSDILGLEDALGDMDFKVCGSADGITAFQMDIKVEGITQDIMRVALKQAKDGIIHILGKMNEVCAVPKAEMSIYAPRIETMRVKPSKIATIIGPGGKQIRAIIEETGVDININDNGIVNISSTSKDKIEKAKAIILNLTAEAEIGKVYTGRVSSIVAFGIFVEIIPGKEGLCHVSELDTKRIENVFDYTDGKIKIGDKIEVLVKDINKNGQIQLSRKAVLQR